MAWTGLLPEKEVHRAKTLGGCAGTCRVQIQRSVIHLHLLFIIIHVQCCYFSFTRLFVNHKGMVELDLAGYHLNRIVMILRSDAEVLILHTSIALNSCTRKGQNSDIIREHRT